MTKHVQFLELLIGPLANQGGGSSATLIDKNVSANGTYNASSDSADGYKKVVVAVPPYGEGSVNLNTNGTHDVSGKAEAVVAVPPYGEGSVNIGTNGTHDVSGKASAVVAVQPNLQSKSVTIQQNGTTNVAPDQGKDGLSGVEVIVQVSGGSQTLNDFLNLLTEKTWNGELVDSTDQTVPRITKVPTYLCEGCQITKVSLPQCTEVGDYALYNCDEITEVNLPLVTTFGQYNCNNAKKLKKVLLPSVTSIGYMCFYQAKILEELDLSAMQSGNTYVFRCAAAEPNTVIKDLKLPALKVAWAYAFDYFNSVKTLYLGSGSVTSFAKNAFNHLSSLKAVIFSSQQASVPTLGDSTSFGNCPVRTGSGAGFFYVPDSLLTAWKAASNWSAIPAANIVALSTIPTYAAGTYAEDDIVKHSGHYYRCLANGTVTDPSDTTAWVDLGAVT